jgi:hypothetical protein
MLGPPTDTDDDDHAWEAPFGQTQRKRGMVESMHELAERLLVSSAAWAQSARRRSPSSVRCKGIGGAKGSSPVTIFESARHAATDHPRRLSPTADIAAFAAPMFRVRSANDSCPVSRARNQSRLGG